MTQAVPNDDFRLKDQGYSDALSSMRLPRHRWYFVKEAFSPAIVKEAIKQSGASENNTVIDPFCGSGTSLVASASQGLSAVGYEVNPFLAFVASTKLIQADAEELRTASADVIAGAKKGADSQLESFSTFGKSCGRAKWLFNREVLRSFQGGWDATANLEKPIMDLSRLALLAAAMDSCNAERDGKCLRYREGWQKLAYGEDALTAAFESRVKIMCDDLAAAPLESNECTIKRGDVRELLSLGPSKPFRLCVTSPPYLNSFDYSDVYRPELFLGQFVKTNMDLREIRLSTVRSHVQANWVRPSQEDFGPLYTESITKIKARHEQLWDRRIPFMVQAYFEDMKTILAGLRKMAEPEASLWLVVSTSSYAGVEIPVDLIIAHIAGEVGWYLSEVGVMRYLRTATHHWRDENAEKQKNPRLRESVVILRASPESGKRRRRA